MREGKAIVKFREWVTKKIDGSASFNVSDLVKEAEAVFGGDAPFLKAFAGAAIRTRMVVEIRALAVVGRKAIAVGANAFVDPSRLQEAADGVAMGIWGRWDTCYEHIGENYLLILDMKDKDLGEAEAVRYGLAESHLRWARFFRELRPGMKRGKTVRECFAVDQLDKLWEKSAGQSTQQGVA